MSDKIDQIIEARRRQSEQSAAATAASAPEAPAPEGDKFYSILLGEGFQEHFLELQFRTGLRAAFAYSDLSWFNWDPEAGCLDLEFGGFLITVKGRGLYPALFNGIKGRRVAWLREADTEMQDHDSNVAFISEIAITPPKDFSDNAGELE